MKKYNKPMLKAEIIEDINESVYMSCSGSTHFYNLQVGGDYEHQSTEEGRMDCRYHVSGGFTAATGYVYTGPVYCYLKFPVTDVNVTTVSDWEEVTTWEEGGYTYWIGVQNYTLQNGNQIGFGDLIANMIGDESSDVPVPAVAFSFGKGGSECV